MSESQENPASDGQGTSASGKQTTSTEDGKNDKKRRKITKNPLFVAVVAAIITGFITFLITHLQDQDAANQARVAQQAQTANQLATQRAQAAKEVEADANNLFLSTQDVYNFQLECVGPSNTWKECASEALQVYPNYNVYLNVFNTAISNIADGEVVSLANQFANESTYTIAVATSSTGAQKSWMLAATTYTELIARCGQLVQGE